MSDFQERLKKIDERVARIQQQIAEGDFTPEQIEEMIDKFMDPLDEKISQLEDLYKEQNDDKPS